MRIFACSFLMEFKAHIHYFLKITPQKIQCAIDIQCAYFLYFHLRQSFFLLRTRLRPPPTHTATFHSMHIPPRPRVSWNATPFHFFSGKIIHFQLFPVFLLTNYLPAYIIYEHTFYFFLGQLPGSRPERRRSPPQNRSVPGKNSKGVVKRDSLCQKEGFPIAGNSGNEG